MQDHYANMWVYIAKRFAWHPALIGYDFLNEPFPGSGATAIFGTLMRELTGTMNQVMRAQYSLEDMIKMFSDQQKKFKVLDLIEDKEIHASIAKIVEPLVEEFDKAPVLDVLKRPYPQAVCGEILSFRYDGQSKEFHMEWDEKNGTTPTIIYIPQKEFQIDAIEKHSVDLRDESALIIIEPTGKKRSITIFL